jgi:phosphatidylserine/phosphatidylglycerophosphate/cardiolipin synthase-like enzyme
VAAIAGARTSIRMMLFHLTDPGVVDALAAASGRGVDVQIILDGKNLEARKTAEIARSLNGRGVAVTASSRAFSLTHVKAMVIDGNRALVMSLNLTRRYDKTRDYAVMTDDPGVVAEVLAVFDADLKNAAAGTRSTPALSSRR